MRRFQRGRAAAGLVLGVLYLAGCESAAPSSRPGPATRAQPPPSRPSAPEPGYEPAPPPALPVPPEKLAEPAALATQPAAPEQAPAVEPPPPDWAHVLERFDPARPFKLRAREDPPNRLTHETVNVKRLRLERGKVELATHRSLSLQLDGQAIEWRARTPVLELERSRNGDWQPVTPAGP